MSKRHFAFLDGLRGIGALIVAGGHATQIFKLGYTPAHAYLALDFFFCLSGFVMGVAYDERLRGRMTVSSYWSTRMIRLYPLIVFGTLLGGGVTFIEARTHALSVAALTLGTLFLIPGGFFFGFQAYPVNNPLWSLFFEIAANVAYAIHVRWTGTAVKTMVWPFALSILALAAVAAQNHDLEFIGFEDVGTFLEGFARVACPFIVGLLVYRTRLFERLPPVSPGLLIVVFLGLLFFPWLTHVWIYDVGFVVLFAPLLIAFGAASSAGIRRPQLWQWAGNVSYPLYVLHQPIIRLCRRQMIDAHLMSPPLGVLVGTIVSLVVAIGVFHYFDEPVRGFLNQRGRTRKADLPAAAR